MNLLKCALVACLMCAASLPAFAGVIRGTVRVPSGTPAPRVEMVAYPGRADAMPGMHGGARGLASDAVIYVDRVPARAESLLARHPGPEPKLAQKDQCFVPRVVAVAAGSRVEFPNLDPIYHNVFSLSPARRFDLGKYPRGDTRHVLFSKSGVVNVYCDIHSDMAAFVLVLPNHAFARPASSGEFALPDLPAGSYVVHSWHPDLGEQTLNVDVPATGSVMANVSY